MPHALYPFADASHTRSAAGFAFEFTPTTALASGLSAKSPVSSLGDMAISLCFGRPRGTTRHVIAPLALKRQLFATDALIGMAIALDLRKTKQRSQINLRRAAARTHLA